MFMFTNQLGNSVVARMLGHKGMYRKKPTVFLAVILFRSFIHPPLPSAGTGKLYLRHRGKKEKAKVACRTDRDSW